MSDFRLTPKGEFCEAWGFLGMPKTGKTTLATVKLWSFRREAILLAIDPNMEIPDEIPRADGSMRKLPIKPYRSVEEVEEGVSVDASGVHVLEESRDLLGMISLAKRLARSSLLRHTGDDGRIRRGTLGVPVVLLADELHLYDETRFGVKPHKDVVDLFGCRRPSHVGALWTTQLPTMINHVLLELTPAYELGRIDDDMQVKELRKRGIPDWVCAQLGALPDRTFVRYQRGDRIESPTEKAAATH